MSIWNILRPFGIIYGRLVYFSHFGMFGPRKIWQPCRRAKFGARMNLRVTRLGDFSGHCLCTLGSDLKITEVAIIFALLFSSVKAMHYFWKK
jgi:hypothetical protein